MATVFLNVTLHAQPIVLAAKPKDLGRRVRNGMRADARVVGRNAGPTFRPPLRSRQLRSIVG
jgi:hypothetical protein